MAPKNLHLDPCAIELKSRYIQNYVDIQNYFIFCNRIFKIISHSIHTN